MIVSGLVRNRTMLDDCYPFIHRYEADVRRATRVNMIFAGVILVNAPTKRRKRQYNANLPIVAVSLMTSANVTDIHLYQSLFVWNQALVRQEGKLAFSNIYIYCGWIAKLWLVKVSKVHSKFLPFIFSLRLPLLSACFAMVTLPCSTPNATRAIPKRQLVRRKSIS